MAAFLGANAWKSADNFYRLLQNTQSLSHVQQVLSAIENIRASETEEVDLEKQYRQSGLHDKVVQFGLADFQFQTDLKTLKNLTRDNPVQQKSLEEMGNLVDGKDSFLFNTLDLRKKGPLSPANEKKVSQKEEVFRDQYRNDLVSLRQGENDQFAVLTKEINQSIHQTGMAFAATFGTSFILVFFVLYLWNRDIQSRFHLNQSQAEMKEKTLLLDSVMRSMSEGIVVADKKGKMTFFNAAAERIVGVGMSSQQADHWTNEYGVFNQDKVTPCPVEEIPLVKAIQGIETNAMIQFLRNSSHPEGVFVNVNGRPLKNEKGEVEGGLVVVRDITDQLKYEENVKMAEAKAVETIKDYAILMLDPEGRIITWNAGAENIKGYKASEILGKHFSVFFTQEDIKAGHPQRLLESAQRAGKIEEEGIRVRKDGSSFVVDSLLTALKDEKGNLRGFIKVARDITEIKRAQREIQEKTELLASVLENIPNMVFLKEAKLLHYTMFNRAGEDLLGQSRSELIGKSDYDLFAPKQAENFTSADRKVLSEKIAMDVPEEVIKTRLKGERILHTKKIPILNAQGDPQYLLGISEDITDQKEQEEDEDLHQSPGDE